MLARMKSSTCQQFANCCKWFPQTNFSYFANSSLPIVCSVEGRVKGRHLGREEVKTSEPITSRHIPSTGSMSLVCSPAKPATRAPCSITSSIRLHVFGPKSKSSYSHCFFFLFEDLANPITLVNDKVTALSKRCVAEGSIEGVVGSKHQVPLPARGLLVKSNVE